MLCIGIWMRIELRDYVDVSAESGRAALLSLACLGATLTLTATLACCCTTHGHPALLYLVRTYFTLGMNIKLPMRRLSARDVFVGSYSFCPELLIKRSTKIILLSVWRIFSCRYITGTWSRCINLCLSYQFKRSVWSGFQRYHGCIWRK